MSSPITPNDVLVYNKAKKVWLIGERELSKGEMDNLRADATMIANSKLWKLVILQSKYYAQVRAIDDEDNRGAREYHKAVRTIEDFIHNLLK